MQPLLLALASEALRLRAREWAAVAQGLAVRPGRAALPYAKRLRSISSVAATLAAALAVGGAPARDVKLPARWKSLVRMR